jgi:hypothetical protein
MEGELRFGGFYTAYLKPDDKYDIYHKGKLVGLSVSAELVTIIVNSFKS